MLTELTKNLVEKTGWSIREIDDTEFESLIEYLNSKPSGEPEGYIDNVF